MSLKDYIKPRKKEEPTKNVSKNSTEKAPDPGQIFADEKKADYPSKENIVNGKNDHKPTLDPFDPFTDPRPDMESDSALWEKLFKIAFDLHGNNWLVGIMHGIRCGGTRLYIDSGRYVLRPEIGDHCWKSKAEYERIRDSWLKPNRQEVKEVLEILYREVMDPK